MKQSLFIVLLCCILGLTARAQMSLMREKSPEFFSSDRAREIGDNLLLYQRATGGWPKNIDMTKPLSPQERAKVLSEKSRQDDSTTDNHATMLQMRYLTNLYKATGDTIYRDSFRRGVMFLLTGQYDNGGWPQFWPRMRDYQVHITYNDNAMINTMELLRDVAQAKAPFDGDLTDQRLKVLSTRAFDRGVDCILKTQIVAYDNPTIWCQQHHYETLLPVAARAFELPSYSTAESAAIVELLMEIPEPTPEIKRAVNGAMQWFDKYKITGLRKEATGTYNSYDRNVRLVEDPNAPTPLWSRYYDLEFCEPFVCDRDGIMRRNLEDIGLERRCGYGWFTDRPADIYNKYEKWANKWCPDEKLAVSLNSPGGNETGVFTLGRKPALRAEDFDAVVLPGQSIQAAIDRVPAMQSTPYTILVREGEYAQDVIMQRPNVVLVGENRETTKIKGVVFITPDANDCVVCGFTINFNKADNPAGNDRAASLISTRGSRAIILNCKITSDYAIGLTLLDPASSGMYYLADVDIDCPANYCLSTGGWCFVNRCKFSGNGSPIIKYDGKGGSTRKLVLTSCVFNAASPTLIGECTPDSNCYMLHDRFSANILDKGFKVVGGDASSAHTYCYGCARQGGDGGWLKDNLDQSPENADFHSASPAWTFSHKWDPEDKIRSLIKELAY